VGEDSREYLIWFAEFGVFFLCRMLALHADGVHRLPQIDIMRICGHAHTIRHADLLAMIATQYTNLRDTGPIPSCRADSDA